MPDCQKHVDVSDVTQYSVGVVYILPCTFAFQTFMNEIKSGDCQVYSNLR